MSATDTKRRLREVARRLKTLSEWKALLEEKRRELLVREDSRSRHDFRLIEHGSPTREAAYDPELSRGFGAGMPSLPGTNAEISILEEQRALLEQGLPSAEEASEAEARARELIERAAEARARFYEHWEELVSALELAERAARGAARARREVLQSVDQVRELADEYGLDVAAPAIPGPLQGEARLAGLRASLAGEVASGGDYDDVTARDLDNVRGSGAASSVVPVGAAE